MISKILGLWGWKRFFFACFLGIVAALGYPPFGFIVGPFIAFPLLITILQAIEDEGAFAQFKYAWFFGLGYFTVGLYWITFSLGVDLYLFWWLIPFALFGIPAGLSCYLGVMALVLRVFAVKGVARCFAFAGLWGLAELAWGSGPLALPWNPLGLIWASVFEYIQVTSLIGIDGLTIITALLVATPSLFLARPLLRIDLVYCFSMLLLLVLGEIYSLHRLSSTPTIAQAQPTFIRVVQPNFPQTFSWDANMVRSEFFRALDLSLQNSQTRPDIIIWPESSLPILMEENTAARERIAEILKDDAYFITGTTRRSRNGEVEQRYWNSLIVVNRQGDVVQVYDKHHLVPFGEFVPFRWLIPSWITKITAGETDFSIGAGAETITIAPQPSFSPLICFEAIFSNEVVAKGDMRPLWLLNISNDAWFGQSSGPYQHLQIARIRAIEEGLPMVRATNSGISILFDAFGREIKRLSLNQAGVLDVELPPALKEVTVFVKYGTLLYLMLLSSTLVLALILRRCKSHVLCQH